MIDHTPFTDTTRSLIQNNNLYRALEAPLGQRASGLGGGYYHKLDAQLLRLGVTPRLVYGRSSVLLQDIQHISSLYTARTQLVSLFFFSFQLRFFSFQLRIKLYLLSAILVKQTTVSRNFKMPIEQGCQEYDKVGILKVENFYSSLFSFQLQTPSFMSFLVCVKSHVIGQQAY